MKIGFTYSTGVRTYLCNAERSDLPWGHRIKITRTEQGNELTDTIHFVCHPEFSDFQIFQNMNTEQLVSAAKLKLLSPEVEGSLLQCREAGLTLILVLSNAEYRVEV